MFHRIAMVSGGAVLLAGCISPVSTQQASEKQLVEVSSIISALKCALTIALVEEQKTGRYQRLKGQIAVLELTFKVVDTSGGQGSVSPKVLVLGAGGNITPTFGASLSRVSTIETKINGRLGLDNHGTQACEQRGADAHAQYRFSEWLGALIQGLDTNIDVPPFGVVDRMSLESDFAVTRGGQAKAAFEVVFFGGSAEFSASRNDVQNIKITIQGEDKDVKYPAGVVAIDPITQKPRYTPENPGKRLLRTNGEER